MLLDTAAVLQLHTYVYSYLTCDAVLIYSRTSLSPFHSRARRSFYPGTPLAKVNTFPFWLKMQWADIDCSGWSQQQLRDIHHGRHARLGRMEPAAQLDVRYLLSLNVKLS